MPTPEWYILKAAEMYADDEHEFDGVISEPSEGEPYVKEPMPKVSDSDDGAWVQGWYWVPAPEADEGLI